MTTAPEPLPHAVARPNLPWRTRLFLRLPSDPEGLSRPPEVSLQFRDRLLLLILLLPLLLPSPFPLLLPPLLRLTYSPQLLLLPRSSDPPPSPPPPPPLLVFHRWS